MDNQYFQHLIDLFKKFPGIGARQAERFAYFIIQQKESYRSDLITTIQKNSSSIKLCQESFQYFFDDSSSETLSPLVRDQSRDFSKLMIVLKDTDIKAFESTSIYKGQYFVLGGFAPILTDDRHFMRLKELSLTIQKRIQHHSLSEIILAFPVNPEGERTREYIENYLSEIVQQNDIKASSLARGLSTGSEIEYADRNTLESALNERK